VVVVGAAVVVVGNNVVDVVDVVDVAMVVVVVDFVVVVVVAAAVVVVVGRLECPFPAGIAPAVLVDTISRPAREMPASPANVSDFKAMEFPALVLAPQA